MVDQVPTMLVSELLLMKQLDECKGRCIRLTRILLRVAEMNAAGKAIYERAVWDEDNVGVLGE